MIVSPECYDPATQTVGDCSRGRLRYSAGAQQPDYIVVSIPGGYSINPRIPYILSGDSAVSLAAAFGGGP